MAEREVWDDEAITGAFEAVNEKLDQLPTRQDQQIAAAQARKDWLTFATPVTVAMISLLGTIVTLLLTRG